MARSLRLETMADVRKVCDDFEAKVPAEHWTLATYDELLFLDTFPEGGDVVVVNILMIGDEE